MSVTQVGESSFCIVNEKCIEGCCDLESVESKVKSVSSYFFSSPTVLLFTGIACALSILPIQFSAVCITGLFTGFCLFPEKIPKSLLYELALIHNFINEFFTVWKLTKAPYFSQLQEGIYLGALPLKNYGHEKKLIEEFQINAVLSVTELFEVTTQTFFSDPCTPSDWEKLRVEQLRINVCDMTPISIEDLNIAADFIHLHKKEGVYIHCKAGRGRSMMCYLAYLMKYEGKTLKAAYAIGKKLRPQMTIRADQFESLKKFEGSLYAFTSQN